MNPEQITPENILMVIISIVVLATLILYYFFYLKPMQNEKNAIKQEAKERAEADRFLGEVPTYFTNNDYAGFEDTELGYDPQVK